MYTCKDCGKQTKPVLGKYCEYCGQPVRQGRISDAPPLTAYSYLLLPTPPAAARFGAICPTIRGDRRAGSKRSKTRRARPCCASGEGPATSTEVPME
jgi:hypothetical protein